MSDVSENVTSTWFDPCLDPSSPYYIHPSENPSSVSISPTLDGSNYHSWSRAFRMALISKNKMGFLTGTIPAPDTQNSFYTSWERCNTLIMSWLLNSLSPPIAQSVIFLDRAADIWTDLRERFSQSDLLRIAELQEEIYSLRQGSRSVTDYFTALKSIWEQLDNLRPYTNCTCSAKLYHQQDFVIRFLKGLEEHFSIVRSQILLMDPLPPVNRVFSMIIQQERHKSPSLIADEPNTFVNAASGKGRGRGTLVGQSSSNNRTTSNKKCVYCGRNGHNVDACYAKHGYPIGHPRYPGRPCFHNKDSSSSAYVNNAAQEDDSQSSLISGSPLMG